MRADYEGKVARITLPNHSKGFKAALYRQLTRDRWGTIGTDISTFFQAPPEDLYLVVRCHGPTAEASDIWELLDPQGRIAYLDTRQGQLDFALV